MNKNLVFAAGAALMCLGAFDLSVGLSQHGIGEGAFASIAQAFMLLFPGWVFMAYSLRTSLRLSSLGHVPAVPVAVAVETADLAAVAGGSVVVPFPLRGERGTGGKPAAMAHSK